MKCFCRTTILLALCLTTSSAFAQEEEIAVRNSEDLRAKNMRIVELEEQVKQL